MCLLCVIILLLMQQSEVSSTGCSRTPHSRGHAIVGFMHQSNDEQQVLLELCCNIKFLLCRNMVITHFFY